MTKIINENQEFLNSLKASSDDKLIEMLRSTPSHTEMGGIPNDVRREMIRAELDYRASKSMTRLTKWIVGLTIVLAILTLLLVYKEFSK